MKAGTVQLLCAEKNVMIRGAYYMLPRNQQWEYRVYNIPGTKERVRVKAERLTVRAHPIQYVNIHVPSGKYLITRTLNWRNVIVEISKHNETS